MKTLFVYGSLKKNYYNHCVLRDSKFLGQATTLPTFTMIDLGSFPGVLDTGDTSIIGELYKVSDEVYRRVEYLESYPSFYNRKDIVVSCNDIDINTEIYYLEDAYYDRYKVIEKGCW